MAQQIPLTLRVTLAAPPLHHEGWLGWIESHPALGAYVQGTATALTALIAIGVALAPELLRQRRLRNAAIALGHSAVGKLWEIDRVMVAGDRQVLLSRVVDAGLLSATLSALRSFPHFELDNHALSAGLRDIETCVSDVLTERQQLVDRLKDGKDAAIVTTMEVFEQRAIQAHATWSAMADTTRAGRRALRREAEQAG